MDGEQLKAFTSSTNRQENSTSTELERNVLQTLKQMLEGLLESFSTTIEEDDTLLRSLLTLKNYNAYSAITYRKGQKEIIRQSIQFTDRLLAQL